MKSQNRFRSRATRLSIETLENRDLLTTYLAPPCDDLSDLTVTPVLRVDQVADDAPLCRTSTDFVALNDWRSLGDGANLESIDVLANDYLDKGFVAVPDGLKIESVGDMVGGTFQVSDDQSTLSFQREPGYVGVASGTYTVSDSEGRVKTAEIFIVTESSLDNQELFGRWRDEHIESVLGSTLWHYRGWDRRFDGLPVFVGGTPQIALATTAESQSDNLRTAGVDEPDLVKVAGDYLYVVGRDADRTLDSRTVYVVDISVADQPHVVGTWESTEAVNDLFVHGDQLVVLRVSADGHHAITVLDIADRSAPTEVMTTELSGHLLDARLLDGQIYAVSTIDASAKTWSTRSAWRDAFIAQVDQVYASYDETGATLASREFEDTDQLLDLRNAHNEDNERLSHDHSLLIHVTAISLDPDHAVTHTPFIVNSQRAATSRGFWPLFDPVQQHDLYVSDQSMVFMMDEGSQTGLHQFDFGESGTLEWIASGHVDGTIPGEFAVDQSADTLRIASMGWVDGQRESRVTVLSPEDGSFEVVGEVTGIAPRETIKSARFDGDRAYVVTFLVTDPLFVVDLSDPTSPQVLSEVHVPGFSTYVHPFGQGNLLTIGHSSNRWDSEIQISLFDVSDAEAASVVEQVTVPYSARSDAQRDHRAFSFDESTGILTVPVNGVIWSVVADYVHPPGQSFEFFHIDTSSGIESLGSVASDDSARRALPIAALTYLVGGGSIQVVATSDGLRTVATVDFTAPEQTSMAGDVDGDGFMSMNDLANMASHLFRRFRGERNNAPSSQSLNSSVDASLDANLDGKFTVSDVVFVATKISTRFQRPISEEHSVSTRPSLVPEDLFSSGELLAPTARGELTQIDWSWLTDEDRR